MPRIAKKIQDFSVVKTLNPRDADSKYMGEEPVFQPIPSDRNVEMSRAFNWYNHFYGKKDAKQLLLQYLENTNSPSAKIVAKVDESNFKLTYCWLARMNLRGLVLLDKEKKVLNQEIQRLVKIHSETNKAIEEVKPAESNKPNVQDLMRERALEAGGELEGMLDSFIKEGAKTNHGLKPIDELVKRNILPQHIHLLMDAWRSKEKEFEEVLNGKDSQLIEGYSFLSKPQLKNTLKFIQLVIGDLNGYINVKKAAKKPRKRKAVPVEKVVAKVQFLSNFKDAKEKLELTSLHPVKLHGASECYLYDTAKRKLIYLMADEYSKTFTVKGTTILGFDAKQSQMKTLRKPGEQLKEFMKLGKPAGRKFFDSIKSVGATPKGRTNKNMLILKAW